MSLFQRTSISVACLFFAAAQTTEAQDKRREDCYHCEPGWNYVWTLSEILATNLVLVGFHRFLGREGDYGVSTGTSKPLGWDTSSFKTNQFGHPYHGGLYHSSARSHGFSYFAAVPFSLFGSYVWEMHMAPYEVSINDLVATTVGGAAVGEATYRLSTSVLRSNRFGGGIVNGVIAFVLNPIVGFHELFGAPSPIVSREPTGFDGWLSMGGRVTSTPTGSMATTVFELGFEYGNQFAAKGLKPFDSFELTGRFNLPAASPIADFHVVGVLTGGPAASRNGRPNHVLGLFQHLDYYHPEGTQYGGQSVGGGLRSRWNLGENLELRAGADLNWMLLGAISSEFVDLGTQRDYDHGTGAGVRLRFAVRTTSIDLATLAYSGNYMRTLNGPSRDHFFHFFDANVQVPLFRRLAARFAYQWYLRKSSFLEYPNVRRSESELRALVSVRY